MSSSDGLVLCRICANSFDNSALYWMFDVAVGPLSLAEIFLHVSGIIVQIGDTKLPQHCCLRCKNRLQEAEDLRSLCRESDRKLREIVGIDADETGEGTQQNDVDVIPNLEMLVLDASLPLMDDLENKLHCDHGRIESEELSMCSNVEEVNISSFWRETDEEKGEGAQQNDISAIPNLEMLELDGSFPLLDDSENRLDCDDERIESDRDEESSICRNDQEENISKPENEDTQCFSGTSRDGVPDTMVENTLEKTEDMATSEPKILKKRGRK